MDEETTTVQTAPKGANWRTILAWSFSGVIGGLVITLLLYFWQQYNVKSFTYGVVSSGPVISHDAEIAGGIKILLDGRPVVNAQVTTLEIYNSGRQPIQADDFDHRSLLIELGSRSKMLSARIGTTTPPNLKPHIVTSTRSIAIDPVLFNPNDSITLIVLSDGDPQPITVDAHIAGVRSITRNDDLESPGSMSITSLVVTILVIGVLVCLSLESIDRWVLRSS